MGRTWRGSERFKNRGKKYKEQREVRRNKHHAYDDKEESNVSQKSSKG